jgi:hypothetical protein
MTWLLMTRHMRDPLGRIFSVSKSESSLTFPATLCIT